MKTEKEIFTLVDKIREISFSLHKYLRHGHLEKVYENGLVHRGRKAGIELENQFPLKVYDEDGTVLGEYVADWLLVNFGSFRLEIKKYILSDVT